MRTTIRDNKKMAIIDFVDNQISIIAPTKREKVWIKTYLQMHAIFLDIKLKKNKKGYTVRKKDIQKVKMRLIPSLKNIGK